MARDACVCISLLGHCLPSVVHYQQGWVSLLHCFTWLTCGTVVSDNVPAGHREQALGLLLFVVGGGWHIICLICCSFYTMPAGHREQVV
jgi:hypothetical protein